MEERRRQVGPPRIRPVRRAPQDQQGQRFRGLFGELLIEQLAPGGLPPAPRPQPRQVPQFEATASAPAEGLYIISVAARILDMHPQTLRKYERLGLINPGRTLGMLRLYSREDIRKLRLIRHLSDEMGLNLAGVEFALATVENLLTLQKRLAVRLNDPAAEQAVKEELGMLLQSLNIPIEL